MRSTFWPNRILERQSSQNREIRLKFFSKRENSALSMKIVQNALFRSCASTFWPNRILERQSSQNREHWPQILFQNGKTVALSMKIVQNALFRSCAEHVLPKSHLERQSSQNRHTGLKFSSKREKQCAFHENSTKRSFQVMRSTFWPNRICERQVLKIVTLASNSLSKWENSALFMKIVQNALFRSCAARFGQIAFWSVKVLKIVTLA